MSRRGPIRSSVISWVLGLGALCLCVALASLLLPASRAAAAGEGFIVVVNADNPISTLRVPEVSNYFLKKATQWRDGTRVMPVDLAAPSAVRDGFCQRIHSRSSAAVKSYWQQMIFSGREVPPAEKGSAGEVMAYVRANRGAIGYVPSGTALAGGVKAVEVVP